MIENIVIPQTVLVPVGAMKVNEHNPRTISPENMTRLIQDILVNPKMLFLRPTVATDDNIPLGGNMRTEGLRQIAKMTGDEIVKVLERSVTYQRRQPETKKYILAFWRDWLPEPVSPVVYASTLDPDEIRSFIILDNTAFGQYDTDILANEFDADELLEIDPDILAPSIAAGVGVSDGSGTSGDGGACEPLKLSGRFIIPPFSVLDGRSGEWQERKKKWLALGITSEIGRGGNLTFNRAKSFDPVSQMLTDYSGGTSVFDPTLCELVYRWFCPENGVVLDPFAGGSVRGVVAAKCGLKYHGNDLSEKQIAANIRNAAEILSSDEPSPEWTVGDSLNIDKIAAGVNADLVFSCPPYADLEIYSDDPRDLSVMKYGDFLAAYREIIFKACERLQDNRFAVFVVAEVRDTRSGGAYRNFVSDTIDAFRDAGLKYYNEMILVNPVGTLAIRAARQFNASRKIGKTHQNVLVFYKGKIKDIKQNFGELDLSYLADENDE